MRANLTNLSEGAEWSSNTRVLTGASSATKGSENMEAIKKAGGKATDAAGLCDAYVQGEFNDWYLPASDELQTLYTVMVGINKTLSATAGSQTLESAFYWSSTEKMNGSAWGIDFESGTATASNKMRNGHVRAIRAF